MLIAAPGCGRGSVKLAQSTVSIQTHFQAIAPMFDGAAEIVIQGITLAGEKFRPSDWADRLCGMMSVFGEDRQLSYSPYLKPVIVEGTTCVVVDRDLERLDAAAYKFLMAFAKDNELQMRPGRMVKRPEPDGT